jgi:hypothetical protein
MEPSANGQAADLIPRRLAESDYHVDSDGYTCCSGPDGAPIRLANFAARIVEVITHHEDEVTSKQFRIQATLAGTDNTAEVLIESKDFERLLWVYDLGGQYRRLPGPMPDAWVKNRLRDTIQGLSASGGIKKILKITRLGWTRIEGGWVYATSREAIGKDGPRPGILVEVSGRLDAYWLPPPVSGGRLQAAFDAHGRIWELTAVKARGARTTAALTALIPFRAVLAASKATAHFGGPTGVGKTSHARVAAMHLAAGIRSEDDPLSACWADSPAELQLKDYECRDSVLVIDGLKGDLKSQEMIRTANLFIEAHGNLANRDTMTRDRRHAKVLAPASSPISTGEDDPNIQSVLARTLKSAIYVKEDVNYPLLKEVQALGYQGLFAELMATYVAWVAPRHDEVIAELRRLTLEIREEFGEFADVHPRHPNAAAELLAGYTVFLGQFASEKGLITPPDAEALLAYARKILVELVEDQGEAQEETKLGRKFCEYFGAALRSGLYFLRNKLDADSPPDLAEACGWEKLPQFVGTDRAFRENPNPIVYQKPRNRPCAGFCDDQEKIIYADKFAAIAAANAYAKANNDPVVFQAATLGRHLLAERRCVVFQEGGKQRASSTQSIQGVKGYYFRIPRDAIIVPEMTIRSEDPTYPVVGPFTMSG